MATTEFDIDSYIGEWGYSNRYIKSYLNAAGKNPVICHVCSGGGDFLMAINIKDQFAAHGSVTVDISGYAASAATLIGLGAKIPVSAIHLSILYIKSCPGWMPGEA